MEPSKPQRSFFTDEKGSYSMARLMFFLWSLYLMFMWLFYPQKLSDHSVSAVLSISLALIGWAGGARVMQYLSPGIANAASAISQRISGRPIEDVTTTTDIQELVTSKDNNGDKG